MEKIGEIADRVLKQMATRQIELESTLISIRSYLQNHNYPLARKLSHGIFNEARGRLFDLFLKYPPAGEKCPDCKKIIDLELSREDLEWFKPPCPKCETERVRVLLRNDLGEIKMERGVPLRFINAKMSDFPSRYKKFSNQKSGLFIFGERGVGKTHLLSALMQEEILETPPKIVRRIYPFPPVEYEEPDLDFYPLLISTPNFLDSIRKEISAAGPETTLDKYSSVGILFLDDLGTEKYSEWVEETLYLLIDRRYSNMRKTFISSNLSLDEISRHLNDRISSRIAGMCEVLKMEGRDRRLK